MISLLLQLSLLRLADRLPLCDAQIEFVEEINDGEYRGVYYELDTGEKQIYVDKNQEAEELKYTLVHECGHSAYYNLNQPHVPWSKEQTEAFADGYAEYFLEGKKDVYFNSLLQ